MERDNIFRRGVFVRHKDSGLRGIVIGWTVYDENLKRPVHSMTVDFLKVWTTGGRVEAWSVEMVELVEL